MTLDEFKAAYETAQLEKESNKWGVGEWREIHFSTIDGSYDLLKKCKGYWNPGNNVAIKGYNPLDEAKKSGAMPLFERWFIIYKDGTRYLCNCNRVKGASKDDEGKPGAILYDVGKLSFKQIEGLIDDGSYVNWEKYDSRPTNSIRKPKEIVGIRWSDAYNNHNIFEIVISKPKMTFEMIKMIIENEGGTVDADGFIHRAQ